MNLDDVNAVMPDPPVNVRVIRRDGTIVPVELVYTGFEDDVHVWTAVTGVMDLGAHLAVDELPPSTMIRIDMNEGDD